MKKLLLLFTLACLSISTTIFAEGVFTGYPSSTTALAYDGQYFWIGQEYKVLKWDKNAGVLAEYTPKDGLPGSWIREISVAPDKKTVWAASDSSVAKFDGSSWHTFILQEGAPSGSLGNTAFERDGSIWILTKDGKGVFRYNGNTWKHFTSADGLASDTVYAVAVDSTGVVWVGTDNGVSTYDGTTWKSYTTADGLSDNSVGYIVVDQNNVKWFGASGTHDTGGITRFDGKTWTTYSMANGKIDAKSVEEMVVGPDNTLWVSMMDFRYVEKIADAQKPANGKYYYYQYLYRYDGEKFVLSKSDVAFGDMPSIHVIYKGLVFDKNGKLTILSEITTFTQYILRKDQLCDSDNTIWFLEGWGDYYWLDRYDGERHMQAFGPPRNICALAIGSNNELWVGEHSGGLCEFFSNTWRGSTYELLPFHQLYLDIFSLAANEENTVWVGGSYAKLGNFQWDNPKMVNSGLSMTEAVTTLAFDKTNTLWMGFSGFGKGVVAYDGSTWTQYTVANGLIDNTVNAIAIDSADTKWFGTSAGISRFDGSTWTSFPTAENGSPVGNVNMLAVSSTGMLWAGTNNGLLRYDGASWTRFTPKEGLADTLVLSLAVGSNGVVWAGTPNGLSRYDGKEWKTFTTSDGLPSNRVQALAVDHNGVVWIGTDRGLVSYTDSESPNFVSEDAAMPSAFPILSVYPNPFNPSTIIECTLSVGSKSELAVYALTGQKIRTLTSEYLPSGKHQFRWDGKDDSGKVVSSGVYIAKLRAGGFSATSKMVLVK